MFEVSFPPFRIGPAHTYHLKAAEWLGKHGYLRSGVTWWSKYDNYIPVQTANHVEYKTDYEYWIREETADSIFSDLPRRFVAVLSRKGELIAQPYQDCLADTSVYVVQTTNDKDMELASFLIGKKIEGRLTQAKILEILSKG